MFLLTFLEEASLQIYEMLHTGENLPIVSKRFKNGRRRACLWYSEIHRFHPIIHWAVILEGRLVLEEEMLVNYLVEEPYCNMVNFYRYYEYE